MESGDCECYFYDGFTAAFHKLSQSWNVTDTSSSSIDRDTPLSREQEILDHSKHCYTKCSHFERMGESAENIDGMSGCFPMVISRNSHWKKSISQTNHSSKDLSSSSSSLTHHLSASTSLDSLGSLSSSAPIPIMSSTSDSTEIERLKIQIQQLTATLATLVNENQILNDELSKVQQKSHEQDLKYQNLQKQKDGLLGVLANIELQNTTYNRLFSTEIRSTSEL